ncbi:mechanosensitive ion channel family protein [Sphingobacterium hungaricum]|uniref:Small conductance mechanosensitive ion channel family transporter n=1 Tax=Sphingobacterium hungaricum TaxID=2082723 RepID=A0A928V1A8_9SPHI|nr:mechanosensitive ion channel domain-containing protein [Sphingobacterium hungaricum]MBE8714319.1 small conductance mechanosensitive ion channel family transporter [Sphingobacterium hungaricum]
MEENIKKRKFPIAFISKLIAVGLIIWSYFLMPEFYDEKNTEYPKMLRMVSGLLSFLIPSIFLSIIRFIIITVYNARNANRVVRGNFVLGINRLTVVLNTVLAVISFMIAFGINPKEFITSMTIVAMAIAVIFREYITNMISGLIIMFSDDLSVGDRIRVGTYQGRIVDITFSNILLQDEEDDIVMIPNNMVFTSTFVNLSAHRSSLFSVKFELPVSTASTIDLLETEIKSLLLNHPNLAQDEEVQLKVMEIGKDYIRYKIDLHAVSNSSKLHKQLENEILKHVLKYEGELLKPSEL